MSQPARPGAARAPTARDWRSCPSTAPGAAPPRRADGSRQRWALAIGHACTPDGPPTVTVTRQGRRTTIHPATVAGLRAAAVTGHYAAAHCHTPATAPARQLTPVTPPPPR